MDNSYFILSDSKININRFHICSWEFVDNSTLLEIGCDIFPILEENIDTLALEIVIPWINDLKPIDLYSQLKETDNSKFIFNDSIKSSENLNERSNNQGVIHNFSAGKLCLLPLKFKDTKKGDTSLHLDINLKLYKDLAEKPNIYVRFYLEPSIDDITTRKQGIAKSSIIYDIKVNERRNLPSNLDERRICKVNKCFCFQIIPNSYDVSFLDSGNLKNIRTLEYDAFSKYLPIKRIKDRELIVVFNKKQGESFSFFNIYTKEHIGKDQLITAVFINLLCSILLIIPSYRIYHINSKLAFYQRLPIEVWIAVLIVVVFIAYFFRMIPKTILAKLNRRK